MSLKDLFKETGFKFISNSSLNDLTASGIESPEYVKAYLEDRNRFIPLVDYSKPENFARFGSAEKYYYDSITRVYQTYPYDGSKKEKVLWELSSSGIDLYIFENDYPRTTGFAVFSTSSLNATDTSTNYSKWGSYGAAGTASYEFISFNGGPHEGVGRRVFIDPDTGEAKYRKDANVYDPSKNRECNLKIGGNDGNTVEFWLKKEAFSPAATQTEVVFDIFTTSSISSSADYGRLTVEMSGHGIATNTSSPFYVTYMSGTAGISKQNIGASLTTSSIADNNWHHYSFRFKNDGSDISVDLFVDGFFNDNIKTGTPINYVSGTLVGTIGSLATNPSGTHAGSPQAEKGWGKLSGSLDEFRFWKVWRTSKEIQTRWFDQVGGGTNSDDANTHLGLYYKFNEGITLTASVDLKVLDYSGRVSNGSWTGYSAGYSRNVGSAINESGLTSFTGSEFRDPILYSFHPSVSSLLEDKRKEGREYDYRNPSTIYYTMPGWILDEHDANNIADEGLISNSLWNLTQILSSYFDNTANLIKNVPALNNAEYFSGSEKPIPFMNRILESKGFITPEIFNALEALEDLENRDANSLYTKKVADVKNIIYKNIYNNLTYINKSKGTEKSFRNLIRCFGVDDEIYKLNLYSNNVDFLLKNKFRSVSNRYKIVNFNTVDHATATVYQYSSSANTNSTTFISASKDFNTGSSQERGFPFSVETSVIFPKKVREGDWKTKTSKSNEFENFYALMQTASLFGMHTAIDTDPGETTWASNDYANFVVKSIKPDVFSDKARFVLTGTAGYSLPVLSSSLINSVYDDSDFNFMVTLYPEAYPQADEVSGTMVNRKAVGTNILLSFASQAQNDRFKINVPVAAGGTGNDITIRLLEAATPSAGTPNEIQVKGTAPLAVNTTATRIAAAINGSSDTSIIQYGAGSGDATNGIAGITADIGDTADDVTIKADITGSIGNSITLTDIEGTFVEDGATGASPATLAGGILRNTRYVVEFSGVRKVLDTTIDEFTVTGTIAQQDAINFLASPKRLFVGAHRTNFTGSLLQTSDVKFNTIRAWQNKLSMDDLRVHASDPSNFSIQKPHQNAYLFNTELNGVFVPNQETLLLHWGFNNVTSSDATGKFIVDDLTSGSTEQIPRYGFLNNIKNKQLTGRGEFFQTSSATVVEIDQLITAKQNLPETINSDDTIQVLSNDDIYFTRDSRPTFFDLYLEKSPYQNISEEMLGFLSTAVDYNNLIGQGVDKYRGEYKELQLLRNLFFKNIKNTPDLDKYIEYFKWFDLAVSAMIQKIAPMSSGLDERPLRNIIESHIFERSKYDLKFPSYEFRQTDPEARLFGINELTYPWKEGHAPTDLGTVAAFKANILRTHGSISATNRFTVNIPVNAGGAGVDITIILVNSSPSAGTANQIEVLMGADETAARDNILAAINGTSDTSKVQYGAGSGDATNGVIGIGAVNGSVSNAITITATETGKNGNQITFTDVNGTIVATGAGSSPASLANGEDPNTKDNCLWWNERAEKSITPSFETGVDSDKQEILDVINNLNNATPPNLSDGTNTYQGSTYALRRFARPYKINAISQPQIHGGGNAYENRNTSFWDSIRKLTTPTGGAEGALISIEPSDSNLEEFKDCDDNLELNKGKRKFKFSVGVSINDAADFSDIFKGNLVFPFSLYSSSVTDNPAMGIGFPRFKSNLAVTNLHHDSYGPFDDVPMQGPFTEKYVGGRAYRHVMSNLSPHINLLEGGQRLEGWKLTGSSTAVDLLNIATHNPKSVFFRDEYAKRPVNIRNIQQTTGASDVSGTNAVNTTNIGNYTNTYEIVMTNGRSINNRYLAESDGNLDTTTVLSFYISGATEFALPRRDLTGSNKAIIVNRFSAPGDPATMGEGLLDLAAAEFSVYNALPFRNLSVRMPLNELHSNHTNQFGLFSDQFTVAAYEIAGKTYPGGSSSIDDPGANLNYIGTGSFHKVNRNTRKQPRFANALSSYKNLGNVAITSSFDNFFIQHQIPQTDIQYAWITASLIENYTGSALFGFEQPDFSNASLASTDLTFVSASDSGSANIKVDFVGLNTLVIDNVLSGSNSLSNSDYYNDSVESLQDILTTNAVLAHRGGPAGGSNWKLYRKDSHPIVRAHRGENRLSYLKQEKVVNTNGETVSLSGSKGVITSVIEPPITSKYKPMLHNLSIRKSPVNVIIDDELNVSNTISHTYMNNIMYFTDHTMDGLNLDFDILNPNTNKKTEQQMLDVINYYLLQSEDFAQAPEFNPIKGLNSYTTKETIYPKEQYTYLKTHRQRNNYQNGFWRDNAETRRERASGDPLSANALNPYGFGIRLAQQIAYTFVQAAPQGITASIWSLDSREDFETNSPGRIRSSSTEGHVLFSLHYFPQVSGTDGAGVLQNGHYPYANYGSVATSFAGDRVVPYASLFPQYNRRIAGAIASDLTHEYKFGDTKWEAGEQSGETPFYDTYDDYIDDIKRVGKDHGIIPEFRISEHMDFYLNRAENGFQSIPESAYEITGSTLGSTAQQGFTKEYLHTDFLKTFSLVNADYEDTSSPSKVTLSADALIKFLPYDGFYPSERTVQIASLFYDSYSGSFSISGDVVNADPSKPITIGTVITGSAAGAINPVWKPLFAPGILYNSIKSGIAVDYPVHLTGTSLSVTGEPNQRNSIGYLKDIPRINTDFDFRVPFEALLDPEGEMGGRAIISSEPHPSASIALTASLSKAGKLNYKLAMNNFLASTIDFFKPNGKLSTLASLSDTDPKFANAQDMGSFGFVPGKEYKMRLVCYNGQLSTKQQTTDFLANDSLTVQQLFHSASYDGNPQTCIMYAQTGSDKTGLKLQDFYGSAFGPPVKTLSGQFNSTALDSNARFNFSSASYEPFTPPYYDGYAHMEFTYRPEFDDDSLTSIMTQLTQSFQRSCTGLNGFPATTNAESTANRSRRNAMNMSASFNLALVNQPSVVYDKLGNPIEIKDDDTAGTVLTIQPKWETPILNFKDVSVTVPTIGSGSIARGMWHQYGRKPAEDEGIFMQIQDLALSELDDPSLTGSLAKQLGFRQDPIKLGRVAETKKISEAIVAIPFVASLGNQLKFGISRATADAAIALADEKTDLAERLSTGINEPSPEIVDMVRKMKKFVIPPHFDFVKNKTIDPFAMFIFDFSVTLKEQDLTDIWQNLSPNIGRQFQKKEASLPIEVFEPSEEKGTGLMTVFPDDTRWMVFKVKERSAYNYFAKTADSSDDERFKFNFEFGSAFAEKASVPDYSYNWPFDFFSLIELAKIDAEVESTVKIEEPPQPVPPPITEPLKAPLDKSLGFDLVKSKTIAELNIGKIAGPGGPTTPSPEE